jgi:hypothetical protein
MSDRTIYCVKTGQPVGTMTAGYLYPPMAVHPEWIKTDGSNLDYVQDTDPRAYVAFCLGLVDTFWRSAAHRSKARENALEHHWSLVRAYELLGQVPDCTELAHALCRFLTYAPLSYRVLEQKLLPARKSADLLAETAVAGQLLPALNKAIVRTLAHAEGYARAGASVKTPKYEIIPESIQDAATGPSNIRSQKASKEYHKNAKQNKLMADIMNLMGWTKVQEKRPQSSSLLNRLSKADNNVSHTVISSDKEEMDMFDEITRIMGGSSYVETDEDDEVEMRTIPRELVESLNRLPEPKVEGTTGIVEPKPTSPTQSTSQAPARLSLLERLKRNIQS